MMQNILSTLDSAAELENLTNAQLETLAEKASSVLTPRERVGLIGNVSALLAAGSIRGDSGGMLWCVGSATVADLAQEFDYKFFPAEGGAQGARVIDPSQRPG